MPNDKSFTLIVIPGQGSQVRRYQLQRTFVLQVAAGLVFLAVMAVAGGLRYLQVAQEAGENRILKEENLRLSGQLKSINERVDHLGWTIDRVERFDQKLRSLTLLSDPQRNLAMGPTAGEPALDAPKSISDTSPILNSKVDKLSAEAVKQEQSLQELQAYFQDQKSLLASVPSTWPARGWVTSDFGSRLDPYTAERMMHQGLDIAAPPGKQVNSPSDGTVIFAGLEGGYGNVLVIDHGYGIKTRYGHLSKILVKAGDYVHRGQEVAAVGNTGRSTGPHLHYEVRVNGLPQNPRKFILDE